MRKDAPPPDAFFSAFCAVKIKRKSLSSMICHNGCCCHFLCKVNAEPLYLMEKNSSGFDKE